MVYILLVFLGLCLGSFVNALVWRIHEQDKLGQSKHSTSSKKDKSTLAGSAKIISKSDLSILKGHSMCPNCHHELAGRDLVPLLSWLSLRGRCRYCHKSISWQYPLVEALTALLFVFSYLYWPIVQGASLQEPSLQAWVSFGFWLVFLVGFMALAVYDLRWMILPDRIVYPLIGLAIIKVIIDATVFGGGWQAILGAVWGVVLIAGLFFTLYVVSRGRWIGDGDITLAIVLGLLVGGPLHSLLLIFVASIAGSIAALPLILKGKKGMNMKIPFGPFLIFAVFVVVLFGSAIITWYTQDLLLY